MPKGHHPNSGARKQEHLVFLIYILHTINILFLEFYKLVGYFDKNIIYKNLNDIHIIHMYYKVMIDDVINLILKM